MSENNNDAFTEKICMRKGIWFIIIFSIIIIGSGNVFASEPVLISISSQLHKVIFDGKWTSEKEWKASSLDTVQYDDGSKIQLRTAHQDEYIYVFLDVVSDIVIDKGADNALICFDGKNNKSKIPGIDDYCFSTSLSRKISFAYQGNGIIGLNGNFQKIPNPDGYIAIGSVSDENDRYSKIPHPSYEFRIPIDVLGRSDNYGFYVSVYEANSKMIYSWPTEVQQSRIFTIPSPSVWGDIISPDKSMANS